MNDTGADNPATLPLLKERAVNDERWDVRRGAAQATASGWADDPGTLPWLKDRAVNDEDGEVRRAAVEAIDAHWCLLGRCPTAGRGLPRHRADTVPLIS